MKLKPKNKIKIFFILTAILILVAGFSVKAATNEPYDYLRIFYYREGKMARESLFANPEHIDVLAPQIYSFNASGKLVGKINPDILEFAKKQNIKIMPLVTNGNFNKNTSHAILDDSAKQAVAIEAMINEAKQNNYWGWQFDFEQIDASYRDKFSAFIKKASDALKKNGFIASVAVVAQTSENPSDYPNDIWKKVAGVYDYQFLGASADFISVMSYDDPWSIGPVTRYPWLKKVLDYSVSQIPASKISMGIPLYYWHWNDTTGARLGSGGRQGIYNIFKKYKTSIGYNPELGASFVTYWKNAKRHIIWYENAKSITKKIELISQYKLHGFSAWALGLELPSVFSAIK